MRYDLRRFREVIQQTGASPAAIARELGCSRGTVYAYLRKFPELKTAFEQARGTVVEERPQFDKAAFETAIRESRGIKTAIATRVGCSRQTVDNALERWPELREQMKDERESIVDLAEVKLLKAVGDGELRAILFTLETLGKDRGWSKRTEVTGADGASLFGLSPETVELIERMGLDVSEVARQFEEMVRAAAIGSLDR